MASSVVVIGAGLQGACAALELASRGWTVTLVDAARAPLDRASLRNEGKIHLGFVYANDPERATSRLMLEAALAFGPLLEGWLGPVDWCALASRPFRYGIMQDSLLPLDALCVAYTKLDEDFQTWRAAGVARYLGTTPRTLWQAPRPTEGSGPVTGWCDTVELAIDPAGLRGLVRPALAAADRIGWHGGVRVRQIARRGQGLAVTGTGADGADVTFRSDRVVNCAWDGRLALDATLGIAPPRPWVHRLKYRVLGILPSDLHDVPSATLVLGPFGDVVTWPRGRCYLSWYPTCLGGWSQAVSPPAEWGDACAGRPGPGDDEIAGRTLDAFDAIVPGLCRSRVRSVDAGVIVAWGGKDIDRIDSELHQRSAVGIADHGDYLSIDTGKLTTAPLFAHRLGELMGPG